MSFFTIICNTVRVGKKIVSVPSRGYVFFYLTVSEYVNSVFTVSVPSRGYVFFYEEYKESKNKLENYSFRPLSGLCLFLQ